MRGTIAPLERNANADPGSEAIKWLLFFVAEVRLGFDQPHSAAATSIGASAMKTGLNGQF